MPNENDFGRLADEMLAKLKNPLAPADYAVARRTLAKMNELGSRLMVAPADQVQAIVAESRALYAALATIGDTAAAEVQTLFVQRLIDVAVGVTGRVLRL